MSPSEGHQITEIWDEFAEMGYRYASDSGEIQDREEVREQRFDRLPVRQELLQKFLNGELDLDALQSERASECGTHRLWGFSGFSGGDVF